MPSNASGSTRNLGPCNGCVDGVRKYWGSQYCKQCRDRAKWRESKRRQRAMTRKRIDMEYVPPLVRTRHSADYETSSPNVEPAPHYSRGVTSFWRDWHENPDNLCDRAALDRWEDSLGISHDLPMEDKNESRFGLGSVVVYHRKNTVL